MAIKRVIIILIFILLITSSYLYMTNNYSKNGIEIRLATKVEYEYFKDNIMAGTLMYDSMNYEMDFSDHRLIMTTGSDMQFENIKMKYGEFISEGDRELIVLGDKAASRYLMTDEAIGMEVTIMERKYRVKGIINNSNKIYIPYERSMLNEDWDTTIVRIEPIARDGIKEYNRRKELAFFGLNQMGVNIVDKVSYGDIAYFYKNIVLLILIISVAYIIRRIYLNIKDRTVSILEDYKRQYRAVTIIGFISKNIKKLLIAISEIVCILGLGYLAYKVFKNIYFNKEYFPDNIFSAESYYLLIKNYIERWIVRLEKGLTGVLMDFVKLNLIILFTIFILLIKDKVFTKAGGGELGRDTIKEAKESIS